MPALFVPGPEDAPRGIVYGMIVVAVGELRSAACSASYGTVSECEVAARPPAPFDPLTLRRASAGRGHAPRNQTRQGIGCGRFARGPRPPNPGGWLEPLETGQSCKYPLNQSWEFVPITNPEVVDSEVLPESLTRVHPEARQVLGRSLSTTHSGCLLRPFLNLRR